MVGIAGLLSAVLVFKSDDVNRSCAEVMRMSYGEGEFPVMRLLKLEHAPFFRTLTYMCVYLQGVSKIGNQSKVQPLCKTIVTVPVTNIALHFNKATLNLPET
jgi:hypothetical protein